MLNFENQTLSFVYDSSGKLAERSAQSDGIMNNQTTWTYDDEGRVHEHAIYGRYWNSQDDTDEELPLTGAFRDVYTLDGQTQERRRERKNIQDGSWMLQRLTRVTQSETGETEQDEYSNSYRIWDSEQVLTEVGYGDVAEPSMFLRLKRDTMNLIEESGRLGSGGMGAVYRRYTHQCQD
jgi:hypothetical protein